MEEVKRFMKRLKEVKEKHEERSKEKKEHRLDREEYAEIIQKYIQKSDSELRLILNEAAYPIGGGGIHHIGGFSPTRYRHLADPTYYLNALADADLGKEAVEAYQPVKDKPITDPEWIDFVILVHGLLNQAIPYDSVEPNTPLIAAVFLAKLCMEDWNGEWVEDAVISYLKKQLRAKKLRKKKQNQPTSNADDG